MGEERAPAGDEVEPTGGSLVAQLCLEYSDQMAPVRDLVKGHRDALVADGFDYVQAAEAAMVLHDQVVFAIFAPAD